MTTKDKFEKEYCNSKNCYHGLYGAIPGGCLENRKLKCFSEHLKSELDKKDELLHDAIGLLMNHEQHKDKEWLADYEEVIKKYEEL